MALLRRRSHRCGVIVVAEKPVTPEAFFQGRLRGWGVARDPFGRILRRFGIEMAGEWSEEHRALHLDETYSYIGGESYQRRWAIHSDEQGHIVGHDALQIARLRGRQMGSDFQIVFDRPKQPGSRFSEPIHIVRFVDVAPGESLMLGKVRRWGVIIATTHVALRRLS
jgi:hypothetical protein